MKVGIFLENELPERGGSYTFESELFHSLITYGGESEHTFVLFSWNQEPPPEILSLKHIQFISLQRSFQERFHSKLAKSSTIIIKKLRNLKKKLPQENWHEKFIIDSLVNNGIDITWSLTPNCITMEMPYLIPVWDLQHRVQPYFPEVSAQKQWEKREHLYGKTLRRASFIITGTEAGKAEIERFYQVAPEQIKILPLPTPQFALNASISQNKQILAKYKIPENYLFYPAQFWPHKNHVGLLLAVQYLRDKHNLIFPVVLVGENKGNQQYIKQWVTELDLEEQVHFLGFVPQEDLVSLYRNAFALTFVTFFGPDNLPPLEAFALGCPVVYSAVSGAKEQLGNAALIVDPKNPEQIALAIKSLWEDITLRQAILQRGLARAAQWTGQDYIKGVLGILDEFAAIRRCWSNTKTYTN